MIFLFLFFPQLDMQQSKQEFLKTPFVLFIFLPGDIQEAFSHLLVNNFHL